MKKLLLLFAAVLLTVGASAGNRDRARLLPALQRQSHSLNLGAFNSLNSKMQAGHLFGSNIQPKKVLKAPAKAEGEELELIPAFAEEASYYIDSTGFVTEALYEGASYLVKDSKAYFAPFAYCDYLEGQVESGECWMQQYYKAHGLNYKVDSITFTANKVIAWDKKSGNEYVAAAGDFKKSTYTVERSNATTIGAYYFPEYNEMMVSDIIGLFDKEGTSVSPQPGYCYADFSLYPQVDAKDYFYKGTFKTKDYFDDGEDAGKEYTGDVVIYNAYDGLYIKGFDLYMGLYGSYVKFAYLESDDSESGYDYTSATVESYQHLATLSDFQKGYWFDLITLGVNTAFDDYATPGFFITENEDQTISIEDDGMALLLGYCPEQGSFEALQELSIIMTDEKYDAAIRPTTAKVASTAYFDLLGRKVNADQKGLIIKKSTMADGSVQSVKVLNK